LLKTAAEQPGDIAASLPLFYSEGVPEELVDNELDFWKMTYLSAFTREKATVEAVKFTPLEEYLSGLGAGRKDAEASMNPQTRNGRLYHNSLPIAGMVAISIKSEKSTSTLTRPAGMTSSGELRFVIPTPSAK
jgi:hypothetical protein